MIKDKTTLGYKLAEELAEMHKQGAIGDAIAMRFDEMVIEHKLVKWVALAIVDTFRALIKEKK